MICDSCAGALPPGARFCPACGASAAAAATPTVEERKLVTVVFCDLVGSTELSEQLDPETLRSVTLRYFAAMRAPIEEFGGTVEKFIGDAVMAVFGVPTMHEDDALRAAAAALGLLDALAALNRELEPALGLRLRVRVGVHTGPAVTSTDVSTRQALVSGETVNFAARLEQNAGPGEILIGPMCRDAIGAAARTEHVGALRLKGKQEPLDAYRLLGLDESTPELTRRFDLPFLGRDAELAVLGRELDAVAAGAGSRLVTVLGEPGIGKTRLVRAWLERTTREIGLGTGRCRSFGDRGTLTPLADAVRMLLAGPAGPGLREERGAELAVLECGILRDGTPGPSFDGTCSALVRVLAAAARHRPVVLVVDDCQWGGDLLLDAVDRLVGGLGRAAVLIVAIARLDAMDRLDLPHWQDRHGRQEKSDQSEQPGRPGTRPAWRTAAVLAVPALSPAESAALAASWAPALATDQGSKPVGPGPRPGPGPLPSRLLEAAGGNPFHLEQLLAVVTDTNAAGDLPPTLHALLGARLDAVEPVERVALDLAAVLGRDITPRQLAALARTGPEGSVGGPLHEEADNTVRGALGGLSRRRLVEPMPVSARNRTAGNAAFRFSSSLVHEAAYRAMAKRTRAERHERAADIVDGDAAVGGHLEAAYRYRAELGLSDEQTEALRLRAATVLTSAGAHACARSDLAWADRLLGRACDLLAVGEPGWAPATRRLAEVRVALGRADEGRSLLRAVLDSSSDPLETAHARLAAAVAGPATTAVIAATARDALPVFEAAGDHVGRARARIRMAQEHQLDGRHGTAGDLLVAGLRHAVLGDAEHERALALGAIGVSLWRGPMPAASAVTLCRELLAEHGGPRPTVRITLSCPLAVLHALGENWTEARTLLAEAEKTVTELGFAEGAVVVPLFAAAVETLAGRLEPALDLLAAAGAAAGELGAAGLVGTVARESARVLLDAGRPEAAAERFATVGGDAGLLRSDAADLDGLRARVAAARGDLDEAVARAEDAVSGAAQTDSPVIQATAALDRMAVLELAGRPGEAAAAAGAARGLYAAKDHVPGTRRAEEHQARLLAAHGAVRTGRD